MEFTLYYKGSLKSNGNREEKHKIRRFFHKQLKKLWTKEPWKEFSDSLRIDSKNTIIKKVSPFQFAPLVCKDFYFIAELKINLLRPEPTGSIVMNMGDIDNRLKTLLDSLKSPTEPGELPDNASPSKEEKPFFCLLEDDSLITAINIRTSQILIPNFPEKEVIILIDVEVKKIRTLMGGMEFS